MSTITESTIKMLRKECDVIFLTKDPAKAQGYVIHDLKELGLKYGAGQQFVKVNEAVVVFVERIKDARLMLSEDVFNKAIITTDRFGEKKDAKTD